MRLTDKALATLKLPAGKAERKFFDDDIPGFGLRLRAGGAARWVFQYDIAGRTRRMTLGSTKALTATRARATASELHHKVRLGQDPAGEKAEGRVRAAESFKAILDVYMAGQRKQLKSLSYVQKERHLLKHCSALHGLPLVKVDRRAVAAKLAKVEARSGPIEANRVRASLSAFFNWCISEGYLDHNPVVGTNRRPEKSRDHVLSDSDLKAIWAATAGEDDYSAIVRLLLLTGCRANEIGSLSWTEVFGDRIVLPGWRVKNSRDHIVPLSAPAQAILQARPKMLGRDFIFGRPHNGRSFTGWSACKLLLDERIKASGAKVKDWTNHDLRRTAATRMAELGVAPHIVEAVLNHVSGHKHGVAGIYNRAAYAPEKKMALVLWADALMEIVAGKARKVVPLRSA
jgi:integrase